MSFTYSIHRIPTHNSSSTSSTSPLPDPDPTLLPFLAGKFSALRLSALLESPIAFSSTFEIESQYSPSTWLTRFLRPKIQYFIAVAHSKSTPIESRTIDSGILVGSVQLYGPNSKAFFELPLSGAPSPLPDDEESKYQMIALYSSPGHRGKGLAKMLIQGAIDSAKKEAVEQRKEKVRIRIFMHPENLKVKKLYDGVGFVEVGLCTLSEAVVQNGDAESLPEDGGVSDPERWLNRLGLCMEWAS
ncbi:hypothetical protein SBOR_9076 [Sclerotinia borealis F-4128]|uniref:N-acetyltransferase domain-containing protein n=1 Tax=Sclerotinia borealis (strain F-4128) TaxID=1432307 RepID=W9C6L1_SCLBF|nr:hypothetical protein SBOR_9076 [Sclerotinia borealis F-4128]